MRDVLEQLEAAADEPEDDRYLLVERLARGGQGEVWLAHKLGLDGRPAREVVLKTLIPSGDAEELARRREAFLREAEAMARLEHQNIVRVTGWGDDLFGSELFLEMERVRGLDLRALLARRGVPLDEDHEWGALPAQDVAWIGREVAAGLHYAHTHALTGEDDTHAGVAHLDLSPDNLLADVLGDVKIADFGITRRLGLDGQAEPTRSRPGKLPYMAPEQTRGRLGVRADVYGLGVTLTVLLTGKPVFRASNEQALLHAIRVGARPTVAELAPGASPALVALLERMIQVDPARRPATAGELRDPFERVALELGGRLSAVQDDFAARVREHHVEGRRTDKAASAPHRVPAKSHRRPISPATRLDEGSQMAQDERHSAETPPMLEEPDTDAAPISLQPGAYVGPWKIVRRLGAGGMGATFVAQREDVSKRACLKVIRRELAEDPAYRKRFFEEAEAAGQASHPNVVSLIDYGEQSGELWAAYELVDGVDLLTLMRKLGGTLDPDFTALVVSDIATALLHLHTPTHRRGAIIHRDVSISNVMVSYHGHAVLIDLGIAKLLVQDGRAQTQPRGKLGYMAPEVFGNEPLTPAADQWSLGVLIYLLLTGKKPFPRGYAGESPPPLSTQAASIDPRWVPIVERLLSPDPRERYASLAELIEALAPMVPGPTRRLELGRLLLERAPAPSAVGMPGQPDPGASREPPKAAPPATAPLGTPAVGASSGGGAPSAATPAPAPAPEASTPAPAGPAPAPATPAQAPPLASGSSIGELRPGDAFGAWTIDEKLGEGGMAVVYRARRTGSLGTQTAALKLIRPVHADSPDFREKFAAEAKTALRLQHQNVVTVLDAGEVNGVYYLAMELVDGCDLSELLDRLTKRGVLDERRLPPRLVAMLGYRMALALAYAHAQGVVHRDANTNNFMVTADGAVKLGDFGVAKPMNSAGVATRTGHMVGKPHYMPPEQFRGDPLDGRADQFGLGCTLYEALAGKPPYALRGKPTEALEMLIYRVFQNDRPHVSEVAPDAPPELIDAIERLLAIDKEARFDSAEELAAALEPIVELRTTRELGQLVRAALDEQHALSDGLRESVRTGPLPELPPSSPSNPIGATPGGPVPTAPLQASAAPAPSEGPREAAEPANRRPVLWLALAAALGALALFTVAGAYLFASRDPRAASEPSAASESASEDAASEEAASEPGEAPEDASERAATEPSDPTGEAAGAAPPAPPPEATDGEAAAPEAQASADAPAGGSAASEAGSETSEPVPDETDRDETDRDEEPSTGRVAVRVRPAYPPATVWVRGRSRGEAPVELVLPEGRHTIVVGRGEPERRVRARVRAGRRSVVRIDLEE
ncbi:MAG TPA: protein kinase [Sandaracinaceae bacterium LLY-WYZ-13_1]|nr:protein kinase [Sandaracinaceae bacterium LLY-WYZ-13_1]